MDETLSYFCQSLKNSTFRGAGHEKPIQRGDCLKRGLGQFANLRGDGPGKKERVVWCFLRG